MIKEIIKNITWSILIFAMLTGVIFMFDKGYKIEWFALATSIISGAYVLTIRNPFNYLAFVIGVISSIMLVVVLWPVDMDGAITYICVFIPAQSYSFFTWRQKAILAQKEQVWSLSAPRWQTGRERWQTLGVGIVLMLLSGLLAHLTNPTFGMVSLFFNALFTTSAIFANVFIIYKLIDSFVYWLVFSIAGAGLSLSLGDGGVYLVFMFLFYTVTNTLILINWIKVSNNSGSKLR